MESPPADPSQADNAPPADGSPVIPADGSPVLIVGSVGFGISVLGLVILILWFVGAALGLVTIIMFVRLRPPRSRAAGVGLLLGGLAIGIPALLLLALAMADN